MDNEEVDRVLTATWEQDVFCKDCQFYVYSPGGPDPENCAVMEGELDPRECPGVQAEEDKLSD